MMETQDSQSSLNAPVTEIARPISEARRKAAKSMLIFGIVGMLLGSLMGICALVLMLDPTVSDTMAMVMAAVAVIGFVFYGLGGVVMLLLRFLVLRFNKSAAIAAAVMTGGYICLSVVVLALEVYVVIASTKNQGIGGLALNVMFLLAFGKMMGSLVEVINEPEPMKAVVDVGGAQKDS